MIMLMVSISAISLAYSI